MVSSISTFRGKQRLFIMGMLLFVWILYIYRLTQPLHYHAVQTRTTNHTKLLRTHNYINLNHRDSLQHILVLTHLQNDEMYLENYFKLLDKSSYANKLISIGLLVSDSTDTTLTTAYQHVNRLQNRWRNQFHSIDVYQKDFGLDTIVDLESKRLTLAKAKNFLLSTTLKEYHNWVVWVDVKLYSYPKNIFKDLMSMDVDIIVPNCLKKREDGIVQGYDMNNWQESDQSLRYQQKVPLNQVLLKDETSIIGRKLLVDMTTVTNYDKVPLDGVGATFTMVKATVHREGAVFPPFVYQHELDTEGFAKIAKSMGFSVYGIPAYTIYHF
ncbi:Anp1-domain-containing protein [Thamnidium elegans]|nr:Anp1-domain-containing protein [Thamnidium elegans]